MIWVFKDKYHSKAESRKQKGVDWVLLKRKNNIGFSAGPDIVQLLILKVDIYADFYTKT